MTKLSMLPGVQRYSSNLKVKPKDIKIKLINFLKPIEAIVAVNLSECKNRTVYSYKYIRFPYTRVHAV